MNAVLFKQIEKNKGTEVLSNRSKLTASPEQPGNDKKKLKYSVSRFLEEDQTLREILDKIAIKLKKIRSKVILPDESGDLDIKSYAYLEEIYRYE